jgi:hypothetical protein
MYFWHVFLACISGMYFWHSRNLSDIHHGLQEAAGSRAEEAIGDQNYIRLDNFLFLSDNQVGQSGSSPPASYPMDGSVDDKEVLT